MPLSKTPRIGEIFDAWNLWRKPFLTRKNWFPDSASLREVTDAELDRFFTEHDRQVAERAWNRCVGEMPIDLDWKNLYTDQNPYRAAKGEQ